MLCLQLINFYTDIYTYVNTTPPHHQSVTPKCHSTFYHHRFVLSTLELQINGTIWYDSFVQHSVKFIHIVACGNSSFILVAEYATTYPFLYPFHPCICLFGLFLGVNFYEYSSYDYSCTCLLVNMCTNSKGQIAVSEDRQCLGSVDAAQQFASVCSHLHSYQQLPYILTTLWCCLSFRY